LVTGLPPWEPGEGGGVEHVQGAGLDGLDGLVDGFLGAGGTGGAQLGDLHGVRVAVAVVGLEGAAVHGGLDELGVDDAPVVLRRGQSHVGATLSMSTL
jgi:hypothetical protein